jgi:hypothetical protein
VIGIDAAFRQAQAFDRATLNEVLFYDFFGVLGVSETIPDRFGVDHQDGSVLALVQAAGLVDANAMLEAGFFDGVFECAAELLAVFVGAAWPGGGFVAFVEADEDVMFEVWHGDWMRLGAKICQTSHMANMRE